MNIEIVQSAAMEIANLIAQQKYAQALQRCRSSRLTERELDAVMKDCGQAFLLRSSGNADLNLVAVDGKEDPTWSVWVPLWTDDQGRSDLQLELTITDTSAGVLIELDDLRVP
jgi:hypothetical protein